jgi:hypothetical protein
MRPARHSHTRRATTALGTKLVLFGGAQSAQATYLADTWEWDAHAWTRIDGSGPSARTNAAIAAR